MYMEMNLGFLGRCESSSCSGNSGLSDLVAALKMLSNTLPAFGGDPSLVTLLGWGSGAALVCFLFSFFFIIFKPLGNNFIQLFCSSGWIFSVENDRLLLVKVELNCCGRSYNLLIVSELPMNSHFAPFVM